MTSSWQIVRHAQTVQEFFDCFYTWSLDEAFALDLTERLIDAITASPHLLWKTWTPISAEETYSFHSLLYDCVARQSLSVMKAVCGILTTEKQVELLRAPVFFVIADELPRPNILRWMRQDIMLDHFTLSADEQASHESCLVSLSETLRAATRRLSHKEYSLGELIFNEYLVKIAASTVDKHFDSIGYCDELLKCRGNGQAVAKLCEKIKTDWGPKYFNRCSTLLAAINHIDQHVRQIFTNPALEEQKLSHRARV